jgi:hypothetical protein
MADDERHALVEDLVAGLTRGQVAGRRATFSVERRDDGTVLEVDLGDPELVYVISVVDVERVD